MALTPPETSVSPSVGEEIGPDLNSEAGERPSASTAGTADAALGSGIEGASTREDGEAKGGIAAKTEGEVGATVEVVENGGGVSERGKDVGSSGEVLGCGDAGKVFVEMCEQLVESEALEEKTEGDRGDVEMAETGEMKNVEEIGEETMVLSVTGRKSVAEGDDVVATAVNVDTACVDGSEKAYSAQLQVESAHARGETKMKKKMGRPANTMNDTSSSDELPSGDQQCPMLIKKKRGRFQMLAVESLEHADHLPDETAKLEKHASASKRKRRSVQYSLESPEHADDLYDENVQFGERASSVQHAEHVDDLVEETVQDRERASSWKKRGRSGHLLVEGTEHVGFFHSFQDEKKVNFAVSDLVWGKVRSHPWWPGQIFDASYASKLALDVRKKDQLLVAYFGDKTFAWCDESQLKHFQKNFAQLVKCCSLDTFVLAVDEALAEASRRIELGMACDCLSNDTYTSIKEQKVVNAGIREGTSGTMIDRSWIVNSFQPDKLMDYLLTLARAPYEAADRLECAITNAQVKAFHRSKGYPELPVFVLGRGLENDDQDSLTNKGKSDKCFPDPTTPVSPDSISGIRKPTGRGSSSMSPNDVVEDSRKGKILFDLVEENADVDRFGTGTKASLNLSGKKQKALNSSLADLDASKINRPEVVGDMDMKSVTKLPKIGERICRIAGLLTGSPPMLKYNAETIKESTSKANLKKCSASHEPRPKVEKDDSKEETFLCLDMKLADIIARKRSKKKFAKLKSHSESAASNWEQDPYSSGTIVDDIPKEELLSNNKNRKES